MVLRIPSKNKLPHNLKEMYGYDGFSKVTAFRVGVIGISITET